MLTKIFAFSAFFSLKFLFAGNTTYCGRSVSTYLARPDFLRYKAYNIGLFDRYMAYNIGLFDRYMAYNIGLF